MNPNKALWEKGDFTAIAAFMRESGYKVAQSLQVKRAMRVLDLGSGDGTTAIPMAHLGATVSAIDIARNLVDAGNLRASQAGLDGIRFEEGDASNLEYVADESFDLTLSMFGAMFAPKPFDVASEMVRVTKTGGRIVMGNWILNDPSSFISQLLRVSASYTPAPPEGFISPMTWGVESHVIERFEKAGIARENISMEKDVFHFASRDKSPADFIDRFRNFYGPTMNAFDAAAKDGRSDALLLELLDLAAEHNLDRDGGTLIPATYLRVTVRI